MFRFFESGLMVRLSKYRRALQLQGRLETSADLLQARILLKRERTSTATHLFKVTRPGFTMTRYSTFSTTSWPMRVNMASRSSCHFTATTHWRTTLISTESTTVSQSPRERIVPIAHQIIARHRRFLLKPTGNLLLQATRRSRHATREPQQRQDLGGELRVHLRL